MRSGTDLPDPSNSRVNDEDPKVDLPFQSVDEMLWCDNSGETSSAVLLHGTTYLACSSNRRVCG